MHVCVCCARLSAEDLFVSRCTNFYCFCFECMHIFIYTIHINVWTRCITPIFA